MRNWNLRDVGVRATNCTFYGVEFSKLKYLKDAAEEVKMDWLQIKNCRFVDCVIPESLLIATQECVFENCTFGEPEPSVVASEMITVKMYLPSAIPAPKLGPNRAVQMIDAAKIPVPAGSTLKHVRRGERIEMK